MKRILVWFRNDLRVHDQELLNIASEYNPINIIPVYCFDDRQFGATTPFGFAKTGKFRTKFIQESVIDLRNNLQKIGSNLIVRKGLPEKVISEIAVEQKVDLVLFSQEATSEEKQVGNKLIQALQKAQIKVDTVWQSTLHHPDELPFAVKDIPDLFTSFRKKVEKQSEVYQCEDPITKLAPIGDIKIGDIPPLKELGVGGDTPADPRGVLEFRGGETEALKRLDHYFWQEDCLREYKETRNGMLGADYSSKFSPWLAHGCISPRYIYQQVEKYEAERVKNNSTYWLVFELLWRDFFRFTAVKYGDRLFYKSGLQNINIPWQENRSLFEAWAEGKTGYPLVDANMRELKATGFMSNRGRQNVASFLTKNLGLDWRMGAEWFESLLLDYDPCSNWGNWNYTAGIGNDARGFRYFNIPKQSKDYDRKGKYLRHWLPEIAGIKGDKIHTPWKLSRGEQKQCSLQLGVDYPNPIVDFFSSVKHNEKVYLNKN